jgi:hypothetical protein
VRATDQSAPARGAAGWHSATDLFDASGPTATLFARRTGCETALASLQTSIEHSIARFGTAILAAPDTSLRAPPHADTPRVHVRIQDAWANINEAGHSNSAHTHGSSHVSGVVYIDAGNSTGGRSCTLLQNPAPSDLRHGIVEGSGGFTGAGEDICLPPVPGSVLLFPGWLPHAVLPHDGTQPRLSVSFNADFVYPSGEAATLRNSDEWTNPVVNEASTDLKWLAAARGGNNGKPMAWLRHAWPREAVIWSVSRLPLATLERDGASLSDLSDRQKLATLSDESIAVTLHELACLLTARYLHVVVTEGSVTTSTEEFGHRTAASGAESNLEPCDAWEFDFEIVSISAGARTYLPSGSTTNSGGSSICGVVRLDSGTPHQVEMQGLGEGPELFGDVLVDSADPRPEYGFELGTSGRDTRFLYSLGLETRSEQEKNWSRKLVDMRPSQRVRLGHGEAVVLPCTSGLARDVWVSSETIAPVSVATFVATWC